jgi:hypothetical protein
VDEDLACPNSYIYRLIYMHSEEEKRPMSSTAKISSVMDSDLFSFPSNSQIAVETNFGVNAVLSSFAVNPLPPADTMHPYKRIYVHYYHVRNNWFSGRGVSNIFPAHGNHVVTCLQLKGNQLISGSDDHSILIFDLTRRKRQSALRQDRQGTLKHLCHFMI